MEELANATGPRMDVLNSHCLDFMQSIKVWMYDMTLLYAIFHMSLVLLPFQTW